MTKDLKKEIAVLKRKNQRPITRNIRYQKKEFKKRHEEIEKYRILRIIEQTWAGRRQTTEKRKFMIDFKEELKRRIA